MGRTIGKLTALKVERVKTPGLYSDGGGLYLRVTEGGAKNWVFRYMLGGNARAMGLGALHTVPLAKARERAAEYRGQKYDRIDPINAREKQRRKALLDAARTLTFGECAERYIAAHRAGWHNAKHAAQWTATLATYANPIVGKLPVQEIDTALVTKILEPIWAEKPETAGRVRQRIDAVLDWATVRDYREGDLTPNHLSGRFRHHRAFRLVGPAASEAFWGFWARGLPWSPSAFMNEFLSGPGAI